MRKGGVMSKLSQTLAILATVMASSTAFSQVPPPPPHPKDPELPGNPVPPLLIHDLIQKLGAGEIEIREEAEKKLISIGEPALEALRKAAQISDDPQIRKHAQSILLIRYMRLNLDLLVPAAGSSKDRFVDKRYLVATGGGGKGTEEAVLSALRWLARHQNKDGFWSATKHPIECGKFPTFRRACPVPLPPNPEPEQFDVGLSGLALMAFLGARYVPESKDTFDGICFGEVVRKGLDHLVRIQHESGRVGSDEHMYNHFLAACALADGFGMTRDEGLQKAAGRAIEYIVKAQNPGRGWRYKFLSGDNDSSATGWAVHALHSAVRAGLKVPDSAYEGALAWYDSATDKESHRVGYADRRSAKLVVPGGDERFSDHPTCTAMSVSSRLFAARKGGVPQVEALVEHLASDPPEWDADGLKVDLHYWFHGSTALFEFGGRNWKEWNERLKEALLKKQNRTKGDCFHGSWEPVDRWSCEGGRVYTTAIGALTLEIYYRLSTVRLTDEKR
jgi:hypothetical protein